MLDKPLEHIGLVDLQELITEKVREGKAIDYKQAVYLLDHADAQVRDKQRNELLKDVSSFANTIGGHLIIGMAEDDQIPTAILGVPIADLDNEKNRLDQLIARWLEPRVSYDIHAIEKEPGKYVLVIRVPQSLVSPHRVVYQGQFGQFWARNSTGAYMMDTSELRRAFTLSETIFEQIKAFRRERVRLILEGETPAPIVAGSKLILHLVPLESFTAQVSLDVSILKSAGTDFFPLRQNGGTPRVNLDGFVTFWSDGYTQLYRNGLVEAVLSSVAVQSNEEGCPGLFDIDLIERSLVGSLPSYLRGYRKLGVHTPIWCCLTVTGTKGTAIHRNLPFSRMLPIDRDVLYLPEALIDDLTADPLIVLKSLLDMMWNAAGYDQSPNFRNEL